jgi:sarcosine oxidase subunit beta
MRVTTRAMRQEVAYVPSPPAVSQDRNGLIAADFDLGVYWRPENGNRLLVGSMEPECDALEWQVRARARACVCVRER